LLTFFRLRSVAKYGFLLCDYVDACWWWEPLEMGRKLLLSSLMVFYLPGTLAQLALAMLVCVCFLFLTLVRQPYAKRWDNRLAIACQLQLLLSFLILMLLQSDAAERASAGDHSGLSGGTTTGVLIFLNSILPLAPLLISVFHAVPHEAIDETGKLWPHKLRVHRGSRQPPDEQSRLHDMAELEHARSVGSPLSPSAVSGWGSGFFPPPGADGKRSMLLGAGSQTPQVDESKRRYKLGTSAMSVGAFAFAPPVDARFDTGEHDDVSGDGGESRGSTPDTESSANSVRGGAKGLFSRGSKGLRALTLMTVVSVALSTVVSP